MSEELEQVEEQPPKVEVPRRNGEKLVQTEVKNPTKVIKTCPYVFRNYPKEGQVCGTRVQNNHSCFCSKHSSFKDSKQFVSSAKVKMEETFWYVASGELKEIEELIDDLSDQLPVTVSEYDAEMFPSKACKTRADVSVKVKYTGTLKMPKKMEYRSSLMVLC